MRTQYDHTILDKLLDSLKTLLNKKPQEKLVPVYVKNQRFPRK